MKIKIGRAAELKVLMQKAKIDPTENFTEEEMAVLEEKFKRFMESIFENQPKTAEYVLITCELVHIKKTKAWGVPSLLNAVRKDMRRDCLNFFEMLFLGESACLFSYRKIIALIKESEFQKEEVNKRELNGNGEVRAVVLSPRKFFIMPPQITFDSAEEVATIWERDFYLALKRQVLGNGSIRVPAKRKHGPST